MGQKLKLTAVVATGFLLLASCANDRTEASDGDPSGTNAHQQQTDERGNIVQDLGDPATVYIDGSDTPAIEFTVTDIKKAECNLGGEKPDEGNTLVEISLEAKTSKDATEDNGFYDVDFAANEWKATGSEGKDMSHVDTLAAMECLRTTDHMPTLEPGDEVSGRVVLEVSDDSGEIIYAPTFTDAGWAWSYDVSK